MGVRYSFYSFDFIFRLYVCTNTNGCTCVCANVFKNWDNMFCYPTKYLNFFKQQYIFSYRCHVQPPPGHPQPIAILHSQTKYTDTIYIKFLCLLFPRNWNIFNLFNGILSYGLTNMHMYMHSHGHAHKPTSAFRRQSSLNI